MPELICLFSKAASRYTMTRPLWKTETQRRPQSPRAAALARWLLCVLQSSRQMPLACSIVRASMHSTPYMAITTSGVTGLEATLWFFSAQMQALAASRKQRGSISTLNHGLVTTMSNQQQHRRVWSTPLWCNCLLDD